jgi:hypothetical protein
MSTRNAVPWILVVATPGLVFAAENETAESGRRASTGRDVLGHYIGHWNYHERLEGTDGHTDGRTAEEVGRFICGGKFVEKRWVDPDGASGLTIIGFDERTESYASWSFSSRRSIGKLSGKWDAGTGTMTWTGTGRFRFESVEKHREDGISAQTQVSDKRDVPVAWGTSESRRASPAAPANLLERALCVVPESHLEELKPLQVFTGPWRETLEINLPGRETVSGAGTYVARWCLSGAAQLWEGRRETSLGSEEYLWVFTSDEETQEHRAWWFSSEGAFVEYVGGRSPASDVWRWQANGLPAGVHQSVTFEATSPSHIESRMEVRQGSSGSGITLSATARRDGSPAN